MPASPDNRIIQKTNHRQEYLKSPDNFGIEGGSSGQLNSTYCFACGAELSADIAEPIAREKESAKLQQEDIQEKEDQAEVENLFSPVATALGEMKAELQGVEGLHFEVGVNRADVKLGDRTTLSISAGPFGRSGHGFKHGLFCVRQYVLLTGDPNGQHERSETTRDFHSVEGAIDFILKACEKYAQKKSERMNLIKGFRRTGITERECPFCAETILVKANRCKHCGSDVEPLSTSKPEIHDKDQSVELGRTDVRSCPKCHTLYRPEDYYAGSGVCPVCGQTLDTEIHDEDQSEGPRGTSGNNPREREAEPDQPKKKAIDDWYFDVLKKYATFSGRARRKEYWMFLLFHSITVVSMGFLGNLAGTAPELRDGVVGLYVLGTFLPYLAVSVRRLHDTNRSGLCLFISLVPIVGLIVILVFMATAGDPSENKYGLDPKEEVISVRT